MTFGTTQNNAHDWRSNLPSLEYWRVHPDRLPQRFYIAFCLLMSSVQDFILGQKELESRNLNWSATCSYYSLVHGGRLLCFLGLGDYPKQHSELGDFLSGRKQRRRDLYPFDWLRTFVQAPDGRRDQREPALDFLEMIVEYLNGVHVPDVRERLVRFGNLLAPACALRNDSNYEALLIAHEYQHPVISPAFAELSSNMASAAESALPFLIDAFNGFRIHDPAFEDNRDQYETFLHVYVRDRIGKAIRQKIAGSPHLEAKLEDLLIRLGTHPTAALYGQLEQQVSISMFEGKARLMNGFLNKIRDLGTVTRG